jgi:hypothetical protein
MRTQSLPWAPSLNQEFRVNQSLHTTSPSIQLSWRSKHGDPITEPFTLAPSLNQEFGVDQSLQHHMYSQFLVWCGHRQLRTNRCELNRVIVSDSVCSDALLTSCLTPPHPLMPLSMWESKWLDCDDSAAGASKRSHAYGVREALYARDVESHHQENLKTLSGVN